MTTRILAVLPFIISEEQKGFVPGRQILDSIILVHEKIHSLSAAKKEGFLIKLDLAKAYDRVEWDVLFKIMGAFGFDDKVIKIIREMITTPMFSILINGSPTNFFKTSRGLRQGDPISPILFTILAESMSRLIHKLKQSKTIKGLQPSSANVFCTHQ